MQRTSSASSANSEQKKFILVLKGYFTISIVNCNYNFKATVTVILKILKLINVYQSRFMAGRTHKVTVLDRTNAFACLNTRRRLLSA